MSESELSEPKPMTIKAFLRKTGAPLSGSIRAALSRDLDDALFSLWENAVVMFDGETAAIILFALLSRDPTFRIPLWAQLRIQAHREAVFAAVDSGAIKYCHQALETWV